MRTLQRRRAKRGMYSASTVAYPRRINEVDKNIGEKKVVKQTPGSFEKEYEAFIAQMKAEAQFNENKETEPVLAPEQSYVQTEVSEPAEPIKVEVVEEPVVTEEVVEPVKKSRKKKVEVTEEA